MRAAIASKLGKRASRSRMNTLGEQEFSELMRGIAYEHAASKTPAERSASALKAWATKRKLAKHPEPIEKRPQVKLNRATLHEYGVMLSRARQKALTPERRSEIASIAASSPKRKKYPRCQCKKNTLRRAKARNFECCRKAGLRPAAA